MKIFVICVMLTEFAKSHRVTHQNILEQMFKEATYIKAYAFLKMISEGKFSFSLLF